MSYTKPTQVEQREMEVPCPRCPAVVGEWCWNENGYRHRELHDQRFYAATEAGLLPIGDEVVW
jgi:hypothetical protein